MDNLFFWLGLAMQMLARQIADWWTAQAKDGLALFGWGLLVLAIVLIVWRFWWLWHQPIERVERVEDPPTPPLPVVSVPEQQELPPPSLHLAVACTELCSMTTAIEHQIYEFEHIPQTWPPDRRPKALREMERIAADAWQAWKPGDEEGVQV